MSINFIFSGSVPLPVRQISFLQVCFRFSSGSGSNKSLAVDCNRLTASFNSLQMFFGGYYEVGTKSG